MKVQLVAAVFGAVALSVACGESDPGITTKVKAQLVANDLVKARNIDVDTKGRVVTLTGTVQSELEEAKALEIARGTEGVVDVVDNLAVRPMTDQAAPTTGRIDLDPGITVEIKTKLLADPEVSGLKIDVDTNDRVVTLTGIVDSEAEKARALDIARRVENVARVEDKLTVRKGSR